jgi:hypothetical protein
MSATRATIPMALADTNNWLQATQLRKREVDFDYHRKGWEDMGRHRW